VSQSLCHNHSFAPSGLNQFPPLPTACAVGCNLAPLRGYFEALIPPFERTLDVATQSPRVASNLNLIQVQATPRLSFDTCDTHLITVGAYFWFRIKPVTHFQATQIRTENCSSVDC
jgi:hypothetical protein